MFRGLKDLLGGNKGQGEGGQRDLASMTIDDLSMERIRLDQQEKRLVAELDSVEAEKAKVHQEGKHEASERRQLMLARKFKSLDQRAKRINSAQKSLSDQISFIEDLINMKRLQAEVAGDGSISQDIMNMDEGKLIRDASKIGMKATFQREKVARAREIIGQTLGEDEEGEEDQDVLDVMKMWQSEQEADAEADKPKTERMARDEPPKAEEI